MIVKKNKTGCGLCSHWADFSNDPFLQFRFGIIIVELFLHLGRLVGQVGFTRTVAVKRLHPQYAKDQEFAFYFQLSYLVWFKEDEEGRRQPRGAATTSGSKSATAGRRRRPHSRWLPRSRRPRPNRWTRR